MRALVSIRFGSHLYGTATPASDLDLKTVHVPDAREILLGRAKGSISTHRPKAVGEKNVAGEADEESYSLQKYLALLAEGQTVAVDVLFAPRESMIIEPAAEWLTIVANRHRLLTRKSAAFVGYCRQQANKYGIKGSRVAAARAALEEFDAAVEILGTTEKLGALKETSLRLARDHEHIAVVPIKGIHGTVDHLEVCGRKLPYTATIKNAHDIVRRLVDEYGHRALQAEAQQGIDWKALSHAVRVGRQAIEMLATGEVHFPLACAPHILDIKLGRLPYRDVAEEIEGLLEKVEQAAAASSLPDEPDRAWIDDFVAETYRSEITRGDA